MKTVLRHTWRIIIIVVGLTVLIAGLLMLVLPGPGIVVLIAGLAILATEFVWAARLLERAKEHATRVTQRGKALVQRDNSQ
jgi:uncharacterized protein (TIGR02611 family)